jgi:hypothetical protein
MTEQSASSHSSLAVLRTLKWLRKQGFKPVALFPHKKAAVSGAFALPDYKPPDDDMWQRNDYGIGVVTGPKQGGPVDIDLDCPEAIHFATVFLPKTDAVFGRPGKPRSHYLYYVEEKEARSHSLEDRVRLNKNKDNARQNKPERDKVTIVELRADGGKQTVMPGSIHQDTGEETMWDAGPAATPDLPTVPYDDLWHGVRKIAIATMVVRYAWMPGFHNEPTKHLAGIFAQLDWSVDEARYFIQAIMDYTGDNEKSRIPTVLTTFRRFQDGHQVTGAPTLRELLPASDKDAVTSIVEWAGSSTAVLLHDYNERFATVTIEGHFRIIDTNVPVGAAPVFMKQDDFLRKMANDYSPERDDKGRLVPKPRVWLASAQRRSFDGVDFLPGDDSDVLVNEHYRVFNLWRGWAVQPNAAGSCEAWLRLLRDVICGGNQKTANWVLHWLAGIIREPQVKSRTALVLISNKEGVGKSLLLDYFGEILGQHYTPITNDRHIHGNFNKHLAQTLLMHSEEAIYSGDKKHAAVVRSLITDRYLMVEQKGVDARRQQNFIRCVFTSNKNDAVAPQLDDRRYTVIRVNKAIDDELRDAVLAEKRSNGPAALHHFLISMYYDPELTAVNLKNDELIAQKMSGNSNMFEKWWFSRLWSGQLLPDQLAWASDPGETEKTDWPYAFAFQALYASMMQFFREHGRSREAPTDYELPQQLERLIGVGKLGARYRPSFDNPHVGEVTSPRWIQDIGTGRLYAYRGFPSLSDCRDAFERATGQEIEWPEPVEDDNVVWDRF